MLWTSELLGLQQAWRGLLFHLHRQEIALCEEASGQKDQGGVRSAGERSRHLPGGAELGFEELVGASRWAP